LITSDVQTASLVAASSREDSWDPVGPSGLEYSSGLQLGDSFRNCGVRAPSLTHPWCLAELVPLPDCGWGSSWAADPSCTTSLVSRDCLRRFELVALDDSDIEHLQQELAATRAAAASVPTSNTTRAAGRVPECRRRPRVAVERQIDLPAHPAARTENVRPVLPWLKA
jgi:hypothetical protein